MDDKVYVYFFVVVDKSGKFHNIFIEFEEYIDQDLLEQAMALIEERFGEGSVVTWFTLMEKVLGAGMLGGFSYD